MPCRPDFIHSSACFVDPLFNNLYAFSTKLTNYKHFIESILLWFVLGEIAMKGILSDKVSRELCCECDPYEYSHKDHDLDGDRGPSNLRRSFKNYLHCLDRGGISTNGCRKSDSNVRICQRSIIKMKPDTLIGDRGPSNLQRSSKNCLLFQFWPNTDERI